MTTTELWKPEGQTESLPFTIVQPDKLILFPLYEVRLKSGIWLPFDEHGPKNRKVGLEGIVRMTHSGQIKDDMTYEPCPVKVGDKVLFRGFAGRALEHRGVVYLLVPVEDVIGVLEEDADGSRED